MDENAIGLIISNVDTKHKISFESGVLGMKLADMTCTHVTYLHIHTHTQNQYKIVSGVKREEFLSDRIS